MYRIIKDYEGITVSSKIYLRSSCALHEIDEAIGFFENGGYVPERIKNYTISTLRFITLQLKKINEDPHKDLPKLISDLEGTECRNLRRYKVSVLFYLNAFKKFLAGVQENKYPTYNFSEEDEKFFDLFTDKRCDRLKESITNALKECGCCLWAIDGSSISGEFSTEKFFELLSEKIPSLQVETLQKYTKYEPGHKIVAMWMD